MIEQATNPDNSVLKQAVSSMFKARCPKDDTDPATLSAGQIFAGMTNPFAKLRTDNSFWQQGVAVLALPWAAIQTPLSAIEVGLRAVQTRCDELAKKHWSLRGFYFLSKPLDLIVNILNSTLGFLDQTFEGLALALKGRPAKEVSDVLQNAKKHLFSGHLLFPVLGIGAGLVFGGVIPGVQGPATAALQPVVNALGGVFTGSFSALSSTIGAGIGGQILAGLTMAVALYVITTAIAYVGHKIASPTIPTETLTVEAEPDASMSEKLSEESPEQLVSTKQAKEAKGINFANTSTYEFGREDGAEHVAPLPNSAVVFPPQSGFYVADPAPSTPISRKNSDSYLDKADEEDLIEETLGRTPAQNERGRPAFSSPVLSPVQDHTPVRPRPEPKNLPEGWRGSSKAPIGAAALLAKQGITAQWAATPGAASSAAVEPGAPDETFESGTPARYEFDPIAVTYGT